MNYRIETKPAFRIVGISQPLEKEIEKNFLTVPKMWDDAVSDGTLSEILSRMNGEPEGVLGVSVCIQEEDWRYYIAVSSDADTGNRLEEYVIPAATWAIFSGAGTGISIQELERRIAAEWLPTSGYEFADAPDIEVYFEPNPEDTHYEVWVPVRRA